MTATSVLHPDPRVWLAREIDLGIFLASTDAPIVAPASSVDPGPHVSGGLWMSLWDHVEVVPADASAGEIGRSLRTLHEAMATYPGVLPLRSAVLEEIGWLLDALAGCADYDALREQRDRLAPLLARGDSGGQALHGDASLSNLLSTRAGLRWNDLEDVCFGSPAWDVVSLFDDACESYGKPFAADLLAAYERDFDSTLKQLVRDTQVLYGTLWRRYCGRDAATR